MPKGTGALSPLILRTWQKDLVGSVLDADSVPRVAAWCLPRGQGKSTLIAALGAYELMCGGEGASVVVAAVDERQAGIVFGTAARMVELSEELAARVQVFKDRLVVPSRGASFVCLPASPAALEGLDPTLAIVDELGRVNPDVWEVIALAAGKRERSTLIGIGTPGPSEDNMLARVREYARDHPDDTSQVYREFSAAGFEHHPADCEHCWELANPALDDFLHRDAMHALLPPKTTESTYRRARLCQFVSENLNPFLTPDVWDQLGTGDSISDGSEVVIALDGSHSQDATALVIATVAAEPHIDRLAVWERPAGNTAWRVPVLDVEQAIRDACVRYRVRELTADPFRWQRSLAVLSSEGIKTSEFPHTPSRLTAATTAFHSAAVNGRMSHSGDDALRRHVLAATVIDTDNGGLRIAKQSRRQNAARIDLAAAALMALSRATWLATHKKKNRTVSFA